MQLAKPMITRRCDIHAWQS